MATIMLDAGHGGYDSGAVYGDRYEKNDTLSLVLAVGTILEIMVSMCYTHVLQMFIRAQMKKRGLRIAVMRITLFPFIVIPARIQTHIPE